MGVEISQHLLVIEIEIDVLAFEALHRTNPVNAFGERTVRDGVGFMRGHEGDLGARQPEQAHDEQRRHGREG